MVLSEAPGLVQAPGLVEEVDEDSFLDDERSSSLVTPYDSSMDAGRQYTGGRRRKRIKAHTDEDANIEEDADSLANSSLLNLDQETRTFLTGIMQHHFLFNAVQKSEYNPIFRALHLKKMSMHDVVFRQGDKGECLYFIRSGTFQVSIDGRNLKELGSSETFGELALLYQMERTATITCISEVGEVLVMDRKRFRSCMDNLTSKLYEKAVTFFRSDPNFRGLPEADQTHLAKACSMQEFNDGEQILRAGEVGDWLFIVMSGRVEHTDTRFDLDFEKTGCCLGSLGLLYGKRQVAGAKARGQVTCLALGRTALSKLPDPVADVFRRSAFQTMLQCLHRKGDEPDLFGHLTVEQRHRLVASAEDAVFEPGEIIVARGDPAQLIVVVEGEVALMSEVASWEERGDLCFCTIAGTEEDAEQRVRSKAERVLTNGMGYGEQPELRDGVEMPRFAVAIGHVRLHRLTYEAIMATLGEPLADLARRNEIKAVLSDIFLFKNLSGRQIDDTVRCLEQQRFAAGENIVRQDDPAKHFFLIQSGTICVKKDNSVLRTLGRWDYFGERGLLNEERRSATCQAMEECVCLVLDGYVFVEIVGMFRKELDRRMQLQDLDLTMSDLRNKAVVGRGTFGTVRLVWHKSDENKQYALKVVSKLHVVKNSQEKSIVMEREVNAQCFHPCIVQFIKTFQDLANVHFLMEFLGGGDLFQVIRQIGMLTKQQTQFFSGSICLAIEYLHGRGIMYRDLKPENVLLDFEGCAKLVDFGCCKKELNAYTLIGTPEYLAPEVVSRKGYTCSVDWWSLGVMCHEFIVGPLPFGANTDDQMQLFKEILEEPLVIPDSVTDETAASVLMRLMDRNGSHRLGGSANGAKEIKAHPYFEDFDWDALAGGFLVPPWKPDAEAIRRHWEPADGDLMQHVVKGKVKEHRGMEWAKGF